MNIMTFRLKKQAQTGFTMLEVVVAMAVGAVGIIAFIGLQLKSMEISEESRQMSNAAYIAQEMAERMMSNSQDFQAQLVYQGDAGSDWDEEPSDDGFLDQINSCTGLACVVAADAAAFDIAEVKYLARATLPNGDVGYRKCGVGDAFDCIVVTWEDQNVNCSNVESDCYVLQLKIW